MAVAGLVLGIVAVVLAFIPCIGWLAFIPAVVGIVLAALGLSQAKKTGASKRMAVAGIVCGIAACIWTPIWNGIIIPAALESAAEGLMEDMTEEMEENMEEMRQKAKELEQSQQ